MSKKRDTTIGYDVIRPKLIQLTQCGCPDFNDGKPTPVFINPELITSIRYGRSDWRKFGTDEHHDSFEATIVVTTNEHFLIVETVEEVARRRDAALGHHWGDRI